MHMAACTAPNDINELEKAIEISAHAMAKFDEKVICHPSVTCCGESAGSIAFSVLQVPITCSRSLSSWLVGLWIQVSKYLIERRLLVLGTFLDSLIRSLEHWQTKGVFWARDNWNIPLLRFIPVTCRQPSRISRMIQIMFASYNQGG